MNKIKVALAQIAPVWLNKDKTIEKIKNYIENAGKQNCNLIVFGEALLPGYPFWPALTNGVEFNSKVQKEIHAHYIRNSIDIAKGDLESICETAKKYNISVYLGMIEKTQERGQSLYCTLTYINQDGEIKSTHRKLQPTYEERLVWAPGDGNGLQVHPLEGFTVGGLNCWENWMPLSRTALYGLGENLHIAVWPGGINNTHDITKFMAKEGRSFVVSVSAVMRREDFPKETPHLSEILKNAPDTLANGGSCIAGPDGEWIMEPITNQEGLFVHTLDFNRVLEERQNFDVVGHYSRPDVTQLKVNRTRQLVVEVFDDNEKQD